MSGEEVLCSDEVSVLLPESTVDEVDMGTGLMGSNARPSNAGDILFSYVYGLYKLCSKCPIQLNQIKSKYATHSLRVFFSDQEEVS